MGNSNDLKLIFWSNGDSSVGVSGINIKVEVEGVKVMNDDIKDLQNAICATISEWCGERVQTSTEDELRQINASENAYNERMASSRRIATGDFTEELDK